MRIVHSEVSNTQMVALNILYDVGAKDESEDHTGFAHLFEHLMFSGSRNVENYDICIQNAGGENNAWTNNDFTNYFVSIPKDNVDTAFWLESDRMMALNINDYNLNVQKHVVCEEFKQRTLNCPYGDVGHLMRQLCYKVHPYKWPTIGKEISHIENACLDDVLQFYKKHYVPNNAILVITGNIAFEQAVSLSEKWFGDIPSGETHNRNLPQEPKQDGSRFLSIKRDVPIDALYMSFRMCDRRDRDYYVFDIISDILSNGKSSRFIIDLVKKKKLFSDIDAYITGSIEPGLFQIAGKLSPECSFPEAEQSIWQEINSLKECCISTYELNKVKNKFESNFIFSNLNYLNLASNLAFFELIGDANFINQEVEKYSSITIEDIKRVLNDYFVPSNCSIIYYKANR